MNIAIQPILIRGGRIIDPASATEEIADLLLSEGKILATGKNLATPDGAMTIDASGLFEHVLPTDVLARFR